jgi:hypothetical protein
MISPRQLVIGMAREKQDMYWKEEINTAGDARAAENRKQRCVL